MKQFFAVVVALLLAAPLAQAQIVTPQPSPLAKVEQRVGITDITLTYSRPSRKNRKIFGDVVAYNEIWRFGANAPTKIKFSDSVRFGGQPVAPGEYAMYAIPGETAFTIFLGKNPNQQAGDFKQNEAVAKIEAKAVALPYGVETFTLAFNDLTTNSAQLVMMWEKTSVTIPIEVEVDRKVMASINKTMNDVNPYWAAATYYYETGRDLKQALAWVDQVIAKNNKYWTQHLRAKIQQKMGDCKGALVTAQKSLDMAKAENDKAYIKNNERLIAECKGK